MSNTKEKIITLNEDCCRKIMTCLSSGKTLRETSEYIIKHHPHLPGSLASIEIYLMKIRQRNNCKTTVQLMWKHGAEYQIKFNI